MVDESSVLPKKTDIKSRMESLITESPELKLRQGEEIKRDLNPHWLAFYNLYFIWLYVMILSLLFAAFSPQLADMLENKTNIITALTRGLLMGSIGLLLNGTAFFAGMVGMGVAETLREISMFISNPPVEYIAIVFWAFLIFMPSFFISVLRIEWKWIAILSGVAIFAVIIPIILELPPISTYVIGFLLSGVGMYGVDKYRLAHRFIITTQRIVTQVDFIDHKRSELDYGNIQNLVLHQSLIGKIFNFGTLIPVTASGLGMGSDAAAITFGGGFSPSKGAILGGAVTGTRSVQVPRVRSAYALFGIEKPYDLYNMVSEFMHLDDESTHLQEMTEYLKEMVATNKQISSNIKK